MQFFQYEMLELNYAAAVPQGSEAVVDLTAVFTKGEESWTVRDFYAGAGRYAVRFLPLEAGEYAYAITGVVSECGSVMVQPARGGASWPGEGEGHPSLSYGRHTLDRPGHNDLCCDAPGCGAH